jgi:hypothetical protein
MSRSNKFPTDEDETGEHEIEIEETREDEIELDEIDESNFGPTCVRTFRSGLANWGRVLT